MLKRNQICRNRFRIIFISLLSLSSIVVQANQVLNESMNLELQAVQKPAISIIIDDMGYRLYSGNRAINLPGDVTYSFLPHSPHVVSLSQLAHDQNKEIMLHLPMEAESGKKLGPGGLTECMSEKKFSKVLESSINSIPHVKGFNNHMGSLLTASKHWMVKLMSKVALEKDLFFVDSKTTNKSVALKVARAQGLKSIKRDIFIDHEETTVFINKQLRKLINKAKKNGTALAIAHPKKLTLAILEKWIPELEKNNIQLVSVSKLIKLQQQTKLAQIRATNNKYQSEIH